MERAIKRHRASAGTIVLLDPRDASILAIANSPSFDPNRFLDFPQESWRNRAVEYVYEPGSTFKAVTAAAAIDELVVHPEDTFNCENGAIVIDGARIRDHRPFGELTFREAVTKSSNIGMIKTALRLGGEEFESAILRFGFGEKTGVGLPGEARGIVPEPERWADRRTVAYSSFGQGLAATPLQLANAYATLANGGLSNRPRVVDRFSDQVATTAPEKPSRRVVSAATAQTVLRILEGVVVDGTGTQAAIDGYRVAGKTGTAEKSSQHGYSETARIAGFVGVAPARAPQLVGLVMIDEPSGETGGGVVAAPVFRELMKEALLYLGIAPVRDAWDAPTRPIQVPAEATS